MDGYYFKSRGVFELYIRVRYDTGMTLTLSTRPKGGTEFNPPSAYRSYTVSFTRANAQATLLAIKARLEHNYGQLPVDFDDGQQLTIGRMQKDDTEWFLGFDDDLIYLRDADIQQIAGWLENYWGLMILTDLT